MTKGILILFSIMGIVAIAGYWISMAMDISWFTTSACIAIALLILGDSAFEDDLIQSASLHHEKEWARGEAQREVRRNWKVNGSITIFLFLAILISEVVVTH